MNEMECRICSALPESLMRKVRRMYNDSFYAALRKREGLGREKAATCAASLPVPSNLNISLILCKLLRLGQCSASGKSEQKLLGCVVNRFVLYYANVKKGCRENGECIRTT